MAVSSILNVAPEAVTVLDVRDVTIPLRRRAILNTVQGVEVDFAVKSDALTPEAVAAALTSALSSGSLKVKLEELGLRNANPVGDLDVFDLKGPEAGKDADGGAKDATAAQGGKVR